MIKIKPKINLLVLRCNNIIEIKNFYENLGLYFVKEQHGNSPIHYSTGINGLTLELYPASNRFPVDSCRLGFSYSNFTELSVLMNADIKQKDGNDFFIIVDPDGRKVEITAQ